MNCYDSLLTFASLHISIIQLMTRTRTDCCFFKTAISLVCFGFLKPSTLHSLDPAICWVSGLSPPVLPPTPPKSQKQKKHAIVHFL